MDGNEEEFKKVLVRVGGMQWRAVRLVAAANDIQPSEIVREALEEYFATRNWDLGRIQAVSDKFLKNARGSPASEAKNADSGNPSRARNRKSERTKSK